MLPNPIYLLHLAPYEFACSHEWKKIYKDAIICHQMKWKQYRKRPHGGFRKMASSSESGNSTNAVRSLSSLKVNTLKVNVLRCELLRVRFFTPYIRSFGSYYVFIRACGITKYSVQQSLFLHDRYRGSNNISCSSTLFIYNLSWLKMFIFICSSSFIGSVQEFPL